MPKTTQGTFLNTLSHELQTLLIKLTTLSLSHFDDIKKLQDVTSLPHLSLLTLHTVKIQEQVFLFTQFKSLARLSLSRTGITDEQKKFLTKEFPYLIVQDHGN